MNPVFADTSYYLALVNPVDPRHERALDMAENLLGRTFVTEYVLIELGSALSRGSDRSVFVELVKQLQNDRSTVIIPSSSSLFRQGLTLFAGRPDKDWSLVDCISFVVMKQRHLKEALSMDAHFAQAGFRALLREGSKA
jgi:predicted nucleic acid-binding protein